MYHVLPSYFLQATELINHVLVSYFLQATELTQRPTAQRLIRATATIATNLWRRLPDRLEVAHRAIARAAIRPEEAGAALPTAPPRAAIDEFSA